MTISILASEDADWKQLEELLLDCFSQKGELIIRRYDLRHPLLTPPDPEIEVVFVMMDSMEAVTAARKTVYWNEDLPLVMVCRSPDYALEAIRLGVRDYLLQPVTSADIWTAVRRIFSCSEEVFA